MAMLLELNQVGKREDLSDLIAIADMKETPFTTMVPKSGAATNTHFEWQMDNYLTPNMGGVLDGIDATAANWENEVANRARVGAYVQKMWRVPAVSDFAENVSDVAGVGKEEEMANCVAKAIEELKRDIEATTCSDQPMQLQTGSVPYLSRGLGLWINNATVTIAGATTGASTTANDTVLPIPTLYIAPTASILQGVSSSPLTEAQVQTLFASVFAQTGRQGEFAGLISANLKMAFTSFSLFQPQSSTVLPVRRIAADEGEIKASIDVYHGDFGRVTLHPTLFNGYPANYPIGTPDLYRGYFLDMDKLALRFNRRPRFVPLPDLGGGPRGIVDAIFGLQVNNPLGHVKITF
jgi:hypothetical protein